MSAICGILNTDGALVDRQILLRMRDAVDYCGPDGYGVWIDAGTGLAHRLLITTEESVGEVQPMTDGRGNWITADCRVDNRDDLRNEFASRGIRLDFDSMPDSAYILAAYGVWGENAGNHLLGDFAFAIWDSRKHTLFCCRDPLGIKPFYYYQNGKTLVFGSDMNQIFQHPRVSEAVDSRYLADFLIMNNPDFESTPYEAVKRLPPAHVLVMNRSGLSVRRYWNWDPDSEPLSRASLEENADQFRELFREAVLARLRTPNSHRTGFLLSGGLDSSSIVALAAAETESERRAWPTFTLQYPEADPKYSLNVFDAVDESRYWRELVRQYGLEPHPIDIKGLGPFHELTEHLRIERHPISYPASTSYMYLYGRIRDSGVRAVLDGDGGDELFMIGSQCLLRPLKDGDLLGFFKEIRDRNKKRGTPYPDLLWSVLRTLTPEVIKAPYRRFMRRTVPEWVDPGFAKRTGLAERSRKDFKWNPNFHGSRSYGLHWRIRAGECSLLVETKNRMCSPCQLDLRLPYLDLRLFRFMATVPWDQKMSAGVTKRLLRHSLQHLLPPVIRDRPNKTDFVSAVRTSFEKYILPEIKEAIRNPHPALRVMVLPEKIEKIFRDCFRQGPSLKNSLSIWSLWYIVTVDQWLKHKCDFKTQDIQQDRHEDLQEIVGRRETADS